MIDVGSHVVCINDDPRRKAPPPGIKFVGGLNGLTKGVVYTVRDIFIDPLVENRCIRLQEIIRGPVSSKFPDTEAGYDINRFRPLKKLKVEDFVNVKQKEPT